MQCSNTLQMTGGFFCCQVWVPRVHISRFSQHCQGQWFLCFSDKPSRSTWGAGFLGLYLCQEGVEAPRLAVLAAAEPGQPVLAVSGASPQWCTLLPFELCLHKALYMFDTGFEEQPWAFQRKSESHLQSSQCWAAFPASLPGRASLLPCQSQPRWALLEESFVILVVKNILNLLRGRNFLWVWGKLVKSLSSCVTYQVDRFSLGLDLSDVCMQIQTFAAGSYYNFGCQRWLAWLQKGTNFKSPFLSSNKQ